MADEIDTALDAYQAALGNLPKRRTNDAPRFVRELLTARDHIAAILAHSGPLSLDRLDRLVTLDQQLKDAAPSIGVVLGDGTLANWRDALPVSENAWWWNLDQHAYSELSRPPVGWVIVTWFSLILALGIAIAIALKFISPGADLYAVLTAIVPIALTVLLTGSLTRTGEHVIDRILSGLGLAARTHYKWKAGIAFVFLLLMLGFYSALPQLALRFHDQGLELQQPDASGRSHNLTGAIDAYRRAVSLSPNFSAAHYDLGTAYEDALDYENAMTEYKTALLQDENFAEPYNNLARLYLRYREEPSPALLLIDRVLFPAPNEPRISPNDYVLYSLLKNRGWANLKLKNLEQADGDLRKALEASANIPIKDGQVRPSAGAHCLLAQVLDATGAAQAALDEWSLCIARQQDDLVEPDWLAQAHERME